MPSKKVLSIFIVTAALVVSIIIGFGRDKTSQVINFTNNLVAGEKNSIPENPNWQSELGSIAPSEEPDQNTGSPESETDSSTGETATDILSRNLISSYLTLKQNGTLDNTSAQTLIDQTINSANKTASSIVLLSESQLNIIADTGQQSITGYGENLGSILKKNNLKGAEDRLMLINDAIKSKDQSKMAELDNIIAIYQKTFNELLQMPVPRTFVKAHLDMVNSIKKMIQALTDIKTTLSDPVKGLLAIQTYQTGAGVFINAMQAIGVFIKQNRVIYEQNSGGYYLLYGI